MTWLAYALLSGRSVGDGDPREARPTRRTFPPRHAFRTLIVLVFSVGMVLGTRQHHISWKLGLGVCLMVGGALLTLT
jgi:hypothetical protein